MLLRIAGVFGFQFLHVSQEKQININKQPKTQVIFTIKKSMFASIYVYVAVYVDFYGQECGCAEIVEYGKRVRAAVEKKLRWYFALVC